VLIGAESPARNRALVDLALPQGALIVLIHRNDDTIIPNGGTVLAAGDRILVLADHAALREVQARVEQRHVADVSEPFAS